MQPITPPATDNRKFALPRTPAAHTSPAGAAISALPRSGSDHAPTAADVLEKRARDLVGQTFFGTLLKQMHDSPFKSDLFTGGRAEKAFAPMLDGILAQRMAGGAGKSIVRPMIKRFQKAAEAAYEKQKGVGLVDANRRA